MISIGNTTTTGPINLDIIWVVFENIGKCLFVNDLNIERFITFIKGGWKGVKTVEIFILLQSFFQNELSLHTIQSTIHLLLNTWNLSLLNIKVFNLN